MVVYDIRCISSVNIKHCGIYRDMNLSISAQGVQCLTFIVLPFVGLYDILRMWPLLRANNEHVQKIHNLIIPCITCFFAISRVQFLIWYDRLRITTTRDIMMNVFMIMMNSVSIYNLVSLLPYSVCSLMISLYFQYGMCTAIVKFIQISTHVMYNLMSNIIPLSTNSSDMDDHVKRPGWIIPHAADRKLADDCLICLESLKDTEYVHVCMHVSEHESRVLVMLHTTNTILQCVACKCTLHLNCQMLCHGLCPICDRESMH